MAEKSKAEYIERLAINKKSFSELSDPWKDWYQSRNAIIEDHGDDVNRCGQCGWEILSEICERCNSYYPNYRARNGDSLMESSEGDGIDIQFSGNDSNGDEHDRSEYDSDTGRFVVDDDIVEYESNNDNLSDESIEKKRLRGNVIEESSDDEG